MGLDIVEYVMALESTFGIEIPDACLRPRLPLREEATLSKIFRLTGADGRVYDSPVKGTYGGNGRERIYGRLDCPSAARALARGESYRRHRVFFADETTAIAAGFRPCGTCMREEYARWKARQQ